MVPNDNSPQPGPDVSRPGAAAQAMIEAYVALQVAQNATRRANNALDLAKDDFTQALVTSGQDNGYEALFFNDDNGASWMIRVDVEDCDVISITPAMEVE